MKREKSEIMNFTEAISAFIDTKIFKVIFNKEFYEDNFREWKVQLINDEVLGSRSASSIIDGYFILKAVTIDVNGKTEDCYIDVSMPERICERIFYKIEDTLHSKYISDSRKDVIPIVAIDGFGLYEIYYSRNHPEIGIQVLRNGLKKTKRRKFIAMDLGYILRDENRFQEAIEAFTISINEGVETEFCYLERAYLYEQIGEIENAEKDKMSAKMINPNCI